MNGMELGKVNFRRYERVAPRTVVTDSATPQSVYDQTFGKSIQERYAHTQHLMGNHLVNVAGDTATAKTYVRAMHHKHEKDGGDIYHMMGHYEDELVKTPDGWRIKNRTLVVDFETGEKAPH